MGSREILDSWKDVAAYLRRDVRTCQVWEKQLGLPVHRLNESPKARVFAYKDEIERWMQEKAREREASEIPDRGKPFKRIFIPAAAIVFLFAGFLAWRYVIHPPRPSASPGRPTLAVLDFENLSKNEGLDCWKDGLPELLITGLSQSRFISVLTRDQSDAILKRMGLAEAREYTSEDLAKIAGEGMITQIVTGSFLKAGDGVVITLTLLDPRTRQVIKRMSAECKNQDEILSRANDLMLTVKQYLNLSGEQLRVDAEIYRRLEVATTSSADAYRYFLEGRRYHGIMAYPESISYMEKAVGIDPQFAMAYRSMASSYRNLGDVARALKYGRKSLDLSKRLPELERMLIEGFYNFWIEDYPRSVKIFERVLKLYPDSLMARTSLSIELADIDRVIELREYVYRHHQTALTAYNLADAYMLKGLYQKAEELCRSFIQDIEDNPGVRNGLFISYLCRRQFDLALSEAEKISLPRPDNTYYKTEMGDVRLLMDDFAGAEAIYRQVPVLWAYVNRSNLMIIDLARGRFHDAIAKARLLLSETNAYADLKSGAYEDLTLILEKAGRYDEAGRIWAEYLGVSAGWRTAANEDSPPELPSRQRAELFMQGRLQVDLRSFAEAQKAAEKLRSLEEQAVDPRELRYSEYLLGLIELGRRNSRKAAQYFARACSRLRYEDRWESSRDFALFYDGLARALYETGDMEKASEEYEKITLLTVGRLSHGDLYAKAFYMLGKIAERQGDKARARKNYGKFLDLWKDADVGLPEVDDARARLAALSL